MNYQVFFDFFVLQNVYSNDVYIVFQGFLFIILNEFWRMIWEQEVRVIFMVCKEVEVGKVRSLKVKVKFEQKENKWFSW